MNSIHRHFSFSNAFRLLAAALLLATVPVTMADKEPNCVFHPQTGMNAINSSASYDSLHAIALGKGVTVAVGYNTILVTSDYKTWASYPVKEYFVDVLWDGARFVALTIRGKIFVSDAQGGAWVERSAIQINSSQKLYFRKIRFNKGVYVVLSDSDASNNYNNYLSYGDDALHWKTDLVEGYHQYGGPQVLWVRGSYYLAPGPASVKPHEIEHNDTEIKVKFLNFTSLGTAHDGKKFIHAYPGGILHSEDGESWEKVLSRKELLLTGGPDMGAFPMRTMRYLHGKYLIGGGCGRFVSSDNGKDWAIHQTETDAHIEDIVWTGTEFIAVGSERSRGVIFKSPDGKQWTPLYERRGDIIINVKN